MMRRNILSSLGLMLFVMATLLMATSERPSTSVIITLADENTTVMVAPGVVVTGTAERYALASIDNEIMLNVSTGADAGAASVVAPGQDALNSRNKGLWYKTNPTWPRFVLAGINKNKTIDCIWTSGEILRGSISTRD